MFIDTVTITFTAGKGGNGTVAWRREKYIPKGGPTGGDGGNGGSIKLQSSNQIPSLEGLRNRRIIKASNGQPGGSNLKKGKSGKDLIIEVPLGTLIKDHKTGEILYDFTEHGQQWVLCKGGRGGKGNHHFKSSTHQAPNYFTEGTWGESKEVELELKLIADVGLLGMPNAGKSTLMRSLTYVAVKTAPYPFTTLHPNLGYARDCSLEKVLIADIPGIIEGAHYNRGLGISFLRHIERTSILVYVIDISGFEARDPLEDFYILREELKAYQEMMLNKPFLVALNKIDIDGAQQNAEKFYAESGIDNNKIFIISAEEKQGLQPLLQALQEEVAKAKKNEPLKEIPALIES